MKLKRFDRNVRLTDYMPVPRSVLELALPSTAVVLYGILLDRGTLSQKHEEYSDGSGWVYVVYPISDLAVLLGLSHTAVKQNLGILEREGLIRKVRRSRKEANRIFLFVPENSVTETGTDTFQTAQSRISAPMRERKAAPSNRKEQQNSINCYQHREEESL